MEALATKLFDLIPAPVAAVLMLGGFIFSGDKARRRAQGVGRQDAPGRSEYQQIRQAHQLGHHR